jgi:hypothetical protein
MPGPINDQLIQQMVARELAKPKPAFEQKIDYSIEPSMQPTTIKPETLATIGGLADAAGTYFGLKQGRASEANPMYSGMGPAGVGASLIGQLLAQKGLTHMIRKVSPTIADAIAANQGARQLGLGSTWGSIIHGQSEPITGNENYTNSVQRNMQEMSKRTY